MSEKTEYPKPDVAPWKELWIYQMINEHREPWDIRIRDNFQWCTQDPGIVAFVSQKYVREDIANPRLSEPTDGAIMSEKRHVEHIPEDLLALFEDGEPVDQNYKGFDLSELDEQDDETVPMTVKELIEYLEEERDPEAKVLFSTKEKNYGVIGGVSGDGVAVIFLEEIKESES